MEIKEVGYRRVWGTNREGHAMRWKGRKRGDGKPEKESDGPMRGTRFGKVLKMDGWMDGWDG